VTTAPPDVTRSGRADPSVTVRRLTRAASTTPGRLGLTAIALVLLTMLTGVVAATAMQQKKDTITGLTDHREPLAAAAQQIYRSLSDADATAASAFLSGGAEVEALRRRYEIDIAQAGAALAKAAADVGGEPEAEAQVNELSRQLPVYAGVIETARANNRQGLPAGAAYLREASGLMQSTLLPAAQRLYSIDYERLKAEQASATAVPWFSLGLAVLLIAGLVATQRMLTRRTNRLLNVGLVVATGAVVVGLLWGGVASFLVSSNVDSGRTAGSAQVDTLVRARIVALQCRTNETLTLVALGNGKRYEDEFQELSGSIAGGGRDDLLAAARTAAGDESELARTIDAAADNVTAWFAAHARIRELDDGGQYTEAVRLAVGDAPDGAAAAFGQLDENLRLAIAQGRTVFYADTSRAARAMTVMVPGLVALAALAAAGIAVGVWQRLREYR